MINELSPYLTLGNVVLAILLLIGIGLWRFRRGRSTRDEDVAAWAKSVTFSNRQLTVMRSLWQWHTSGREPAGDPLKSLGPADVADLATKCSLEFKPLEFQSPGEERARRELEEVLMARGMNELQAEIVSGLKFNMIGPGARIKRL